jgi:lipopolysaccharide transport system permease protein
MSRPEAQNVSTLEPADLAPAPEPATVHAERAGRDSKFEIRNSQLMGDEHWTTVIRPQRHWLDLRLGELWRYRELIGIFVWRDFVSTYKQTVLGPLWYIVQPLATTITFTVIFGKLAGLSTDGRPPFLFYMAGTVLWSYFAACLTKTSNTLAGNAAIFGKVYFPRLTVPISALISSLVGFGIQFGLFVAFAIHGRLTNTSVQPNAWIVLTPLLLIMMAGHGLGWGIIISSLTTRYRDLQNLVGFGTQLLMYATPVVYPSSMVSEPYRWVVSINPIAPIIEAFRVAYLGAGTVDAGQLAYSFAVMSIVLLIALITFNRVERTFVDTA